MKKYYLLTFIEKTFDPSEISEMHTSFVTSKNPDDVLIEWNERMVENSLQIHYYPVFQQEITEDQYNKFIDSGYDYD